MPVAVFRGVSEPNGFEGLSKLDQVRYIQSLWDRIAEGVVEYPFRKATSTWPSAG